jgi:hypothetical protein
MLKAVLQGLRRESGLLYCKLPGQRRN